MMKELSAQLFDTMVDGFGRPEGVQTARAIARMVGASEVAVNGLTDYFSARPNMSREDAVKAVRGTLGL